MFTHNLASVENPADTREFGESIPMSFLTDTWSRDVYAARTVINGGMDDFWHQLAEPIQWLKVVVHRQKQTGSVNELLWIWVAK